MTDLPWLAVSGFGAHIKSTPKKLIIQKKNGLEEYPIESVKNLLVVGGHTINSATIGHLIKNGAFISFFEPDGTPVGIIRPFGDQGEEEIKKMQMSISRHRFAISIAQESLKSRLFTISRVQEAHNISLFYEGEMQFLQNSLNEISYLIKMDEIRRLSRLVTDMYYEILARDLPADFGFKRRTAPPLLDPINAMLSFGYSMLFGNCIVSLIGARLDPDFGLLHDGKSGLVLDLIDPLKSEMIDMVVLNVARESLDTDDYEQSRDRCILSDEIMKKLIVLFHHSIDTKKIDEQVWNFKNAMINNSEFKVLY